MSNINEMIEVFEDEIDGNTVIQALIYQYLYYKCLKAILRNYYAGSLTQVIDSSESIHRLHAVADASQSCINSLPEGIGD